MKKTHGMSKTPMYRAWAGMISRCHNPNHASYASYGAKGIRVCKRWRKFENFLADMGERPDGMTLDRKNGKRGYAPDNCRWATRKQQTENIAPDVRKAGREIVAKKLRKKTHCKNGHELTLNNLAPRNSGGLRCLKCREHYHLVNPNRKLFAEGTASYEKALNGGASPKSLPNAGLTVVENKGYMAG